MADQSIDSKRTKIVATIGPASSDPDILRAMIRQGMNVARINFSHGDHKTHGETIDRIRQIASDEEAVVAIMCDLQGPKIRIGEVVNEPLLLSSGETIKLTLDESTAKNDDPYMILLPHPEFVQDIDVGMPLLLDDGNLEFLVTEKRTTHWSARL